MVTAPGGPPATAVASALAARGLEPGASVLDAGCGTGRYAADLGHAGYVVTGVDRSAELIAVAEARGGRFLVADLRYWTPPESFDAAVCRGVLNDVISDEDRRAAVRGLARALRPGGLLVVDVRDWEASAERYRDGRAFETRDGDLWFRSETSLDLRSHVLRIREEISLGNEGDEFDFVMRCWTPQELEAALLDAGFSAIELEDLRARPDRIVAIARVRT